MIKFFYKVVLFFLFVIAAYSVLIFITGSYAPKIFKKNLVYHNGGYGFTYSRLKDAGRLKNIDVLILGSSHAYRGLDTRIFNSYGIKAFNLGTSAQTPIQSKALVEIYIDSLNPKLVVLEANPNSFTSEGVESSLDVLANLPDINFSAIKMAWHTGHIKAINTMIFTLLRSKIYDNPVLLVEKEIVGPDTYIKGGGYVARTLSYNQPTEVSSKNFVPKQKQLGAFKDLIENLNNRNIESYIFRAPVSSEYYSAFDFKTNFKIDSLFSICGNYRNYNHIKLNDSLHFYDAHHLNQRGADIFSHKLIQDILKKMKNEE
jgi:hypothetical protein